MSEVVKKEEPKPVEIDKPEPAKEIKEKEEVKTPKDKTRPVSSTPVPGTPWHDSLLLISITCPKLIIHQTGALFGLEMEEYSFLTQVLDVPSGRNRKN